MMEEIGIHKCEKNLRSYYLVAGNRAVNKVDNNSMPLGNLYFSWEV